MTVDLHLPPGYRENRLPVPFDDHAKPSTGPGSWTWQPDVYGVALGVAFEAGRSTVIDLGCGDGRRLADVFPCEFTKVGVDLPKIVARIDQAHLLACSDSAWVAGVDFESQLGCQNLLVQLDDQVLFDDAVVVCSDVIEHLVDASSLMAMLKAFDTLGSRLVLSTPDRVLTRGLGHLGPPPNRHHVREWALAELLALLDDFSIEPTTSTWTRSNDHEPGRNTCLIVV